MLLLKVQGQLNNGFCMSILGKAGKHGISLQEQGFYAD